MSNTAGAMHDLYSLNKDMHRRVDTVLLMVKISRVKVLGSAKFVFELQLWLQPSVV